MELIKDKLAQVVNIVLTQETETLKKLNISPRQLTYLEFISNNSTATVSSIAKEFNFSQATVTIAINKLIEGGFLIKEQSPVDKRSLKLKLTEKASEVLEIINENRKIS